MDQAIRSALAIEPDRDVREAMLHLRAALMAEDWATERRHWMAVLDVRERRKARDCGARSVVEK